MKVMVTLTGWEVREALRKAIKEKMQLQGNEFYTKDIKVNALVKIKGRSRRKDVRLLKASVEFTK